MIGLVHSILILVAFLGVSLDTLFLVRILCYFMHLDLVTDTWWRLWTLQVSVVMMNDLLGVLLMDVVFWSSRSSRARIWINTSNAIIMIWWTKPCIFVHVFLLQVDGATSMRTSADSASFVALVVGFERALGVHGSQEWVVSWTRACRASWLIPGTASIFFNIDVIIIILVSSLCFTLTFWVFTHLVVCLIIIITHRTRKVLNVHVIAHVLPFLGLVKRITAWAKVHEIASAVVGFEHDHILLAWIILILASSIGLTALRQILVFVILVWCLGILFAHIVIVVTSASCLDITSVAIWILVSKVEIVASILTLPFGVYASSISLIKKFRWEYSLVSTEELPSGFLAIQGTVNAWFFSRVIIFWILCSKFIKIVMFNCLSGSYSLIGIHIKHFLHQFDFNVVHYWCIPSL